MIYLTSVTDKLQVITSSAAAVDVQANWVDAVTSTLAVSGSGRTNTPISAPGTNDVVPVPAASTTRTLKQMTIRNKDAALSCDITVQFNDNGTLLEIHKITLLPGQALIYIEGVGFFPMLQSVIRSGLRNLSSADQSIGASVTAYITGSAIALPSPVPICKLRWRIEIAKSAAATATEQYLIKFGTAGTTADTTRNTIPAFDTETAAADEAEDVIEATIRGPIGASCIVESYAMRNDNGAVGNVGFSNTVRKAQIRQFTSAAFDVTPAGTIVGLALTTGASHALTVRQVSAEILIPGT